MSHAAPVAEPHRTTALWFGSFLCVLAVEGTLAFLLLHRPAAPPPADAPPAASMSVTLATLPDTPPTPPAVTPSPPVPPAPDPPPVTAPPAPGTVPPIAVPPIPKRPPPHRQHRALAPPQAVPDAKPDPAPPRQAAPAPTRAPPAPGLSSLSPAVRQSWQALLQVRLERFKRYPAAAQAERDQGIATVRFTMDGTGHVLSASLQHGSGDASLDAEAVALVHRAEPLPTPPGAGDGPFTVTAPISFTLDDE